MNGIRSYGRAKKASAQYHNWTIKKDAYCEDRRNIPSLLSL
jgi:hypothetical protein